MILSNLRYFLASQDGTDHDSSLKVTSESAPDSKFFS